MVNKKILSIGLILVGFLIILLYFIRPEEKPFVSGLEFTDNNQVINSTNEVYADTLVRVGLQVMGIDSVMIFVSPFNEKVRSVLNKKNDLDIHALIEGEDNVYTIYMKDMPTSRKIRILSHELVHLEQKLRGDLVVVEGGFEWNGAFYPSNYEYSKRPWENEAFNREGTIKNKIESIIYD